MPKDRDVTSRVSLLTRDNSSIRWRNRTWTLSRVFHQLLPLSSAVLVAIQDQPSQLRLKFTITYGSSFQQSVNRMIRSPVAPLTDKHHNKLSIKFLATDPERE